MKGHIYKRSQGSWTIIYDLPADSMTGKRCYSKHGFPVFLSRVQLLVYVAHMSFATGRRIISWSAAPAGTIGYTLPSSPS